MSKVELWKVELKTRAGWIPAGVFKSLEEAYKEGGRRKEANKNSVFAVKVSKY